MKEIIKDMIIIIGIVIDWMDGCIYFARRFIPQKDHLDLPPIVFIFQPIN